MQPVNSEAVERLRKLGGKAFLLKMIDLFLDFGGQKVREAGAASAKGDFDAAGKAAHAIKSSAANLGAGDVERIAADIEEHVRAGRTEVVRQMVQELQTAFQEAKPHLEALKTDSSSAGDSTG